MDLETFLANPPRFEALPAAKATPETLQFIDILDKAYIRMTAQRNAAQKQTSFEEILKTSDARLDAEFKELTALLNACVSRINVLEEQNAKLVALVQKYVKSE